MILDQRTENIAISIPVFQHSKSGISMVNCEESVSPSLNRLLSSQAYEWTGTADVETHTHTQTHQIETDYGRGSGTHSEVHWEDSHWHTHMALNAVHTVYCEFSNSDQALVYLNCRDNQALFKTDLY